MNGKNDLFGSDWEPCAPGAIFDCVEKKSLASRREFIGKIGASAVMLVAVGTVASLYLVNRQDSVDIPPELLVNDQVNGKTTVGMESMAIQKISCATVTSLLPQYLEGKIGCHKLVARIDKHLTKCHPCIQVRNKMQA